MKRTSNLLDARQKRWIALFRVLIDHGGRLRLAPGAAEAILLNPAGRPLLKLEAGEARRLIGDALLVQGGEGDVYTASAAGDAWYRRQAGGGLGFLSQHRDLGRAEIDAGDGETNSVVIDLGESPLAWLRTRKGRDGAPLIDDARFAAGERLRADVTRAQMLPRVTANWSASIATGARANGAETFSDAKLAARERATRALEAVGPELSGLLLDVCCFLKGLEQSERERGWPPRTAKVVLGLGLERLAAHYGIAVEARGPERARLSAWRAPDATPGVRRAAGDAAGP